MTPTSNTSQRPSTDNLRIHVNIDEKNLDELASKINNSAITNIVRLNNSPSPGPSLPTSSCRQTNYISPPSSSDSSPEKSESQKPNSKHPCSKTPNNTGIPPSIDQKTTCIAKKIQH